MIETLAWLGTGLGTGLAVMGIVQVMLGWHAVRRFTPAFPPPLAYPPVSVLKPLYGGEPLLETALASVCRQDYPAFQIVFGVHSGDDPALTVVSRLCAKFPGRDIAVVIDPRRHGVNGKIGNLINMLSAAKHDTLVIADSDVHAGSDYLRRIAAALEQPGTGLVTTLYGGLPAHHGFSGRLGATQITHGFLPGALLARYLGRQDCLGATMALRRDTLERIGGLRALADHLADDHLLGRLVAGRGLSVRFAATIPLTTVPETGLGALFAHELRWARTIRALVPFQFAASALQFPIAWGLLAVAASGGAGWATLVAAAAWIARAVAARGIDRALRPILGRLAFPAPVWLLPFRDALSVAVLIASYAGSRVEWRGQTLRAEAFPEAGSDARLPSPDVPEQGVTAA